MKNKLQKNSGSALLEVIVAMVILSITTTFLMYAISSADKLYGKGKKLSLIENVADNEFERLQMYSFTADELYDTSYIVDFDKRSFYIKRIVSEYTPADTTVIDFAYPLITVQIFDNEESEKPLKEFRLIHGFAKK